MLGPAVAVPHPQDAGSLGIHDHGGIAVSLCRANSSITSRRTPQVRWCPHWFANGHLSISGWVCQPTPVSWLTWRMGRY